MAPPWSVLVSGTVTARSGSALRVTVTVTSLPSSTVYVPCPKLTVTVGWSLSVMETTVSLAVPGVTPVGSDPNVSFTLSSSSSIVSSVALKLKVFSVSPSLKVTSAGTPE